MTKKFTYEPKKAGDLLQAEEWNALAQDVSAAVDSINNGNTNGGYGDVPSYITPLKEVGVTDKVTFEFSEQPSGAVGGSNIHGAAIELTDKGDKGVNVSLVGNNNINIEPREAIGTGEGKNQANNENRKGGNIALKPGDDIEFWAHHRGSSKTDEVSVKIMTEVPKASDPTDTDEVAAKLQLNTADIVLTSKDKQLKSGELNVTVNKAPNTRGYLKVRAQAIDLRCEDHGGIALQPKGEDSDHNINKIKFEHGGGDGLEFGTFNTEKTSLFTKEYRFNKDGKVLLATRTTTASDKADVSDPTTALKYVKQADDFYDVIYEGESGSEFYTYDPTDTTDTSVTWGDIVEYIAWAKANNEGPWASQAQL